MTNMLQNIAIRADNLSKTYRLYRKPSDRLREAIFRKPCHQSVESLKAVSFSVFSGRTLGIIGENGAGKSTLLKILAGTLSPSSGDVRINGRVAALLELGSGFHPEFSGRQNIRLNALLLGLTNDEIRDREPDIVGFADIGDFIDRPIKTYSSGMLMRLAFSVATSVNPDILIIDEALSVGDHYFQKKCIDRLMHFKEIGKTILLCSHSQYHVGELCERAIWLEKGRIRKDDAAPEVLSEYIAYLENRQYEKRSGMSHPESNLSHPPEVIVEKIFLTDREGAVLNQIEKFQTVVLKIQTRTSGEPFTGHMGVAIKKPDTQVIFATTTKESGQEAIRFSGRQTIEFVMPSIPLMSGAYQMGAVVTDIHALHPIHDNLSGIITVTSRRPELGMYWIDHKWRLPSSATA